MRSVRVGEPPGTNLHHTDVVDKLQGEGQQFVVGVDSEQAVVYDLWKQEDGQKTM